MRHLFNDGTSIMLFFASKDSNRSLEKSDLCKISLWLKQERDNLPSILRTITPFQILYPILENNKLWYKKLIPLSCQFNKEKKSQISPLKPLNLSPWSHILTNQTNSDLVVEVIFKTKLNNSKRVDINPSNIGIFWNRVQQHLMPQIPHITAYLGGRGAAFWHFYEIYSKDFIVNFIIIALLIALCRFFYGTWKSGIFLIFTIGISASWIFGLMSYFNVPINYLSQTLFVMMCVAGLQDFIFLSNQLKRKPHAWQRNYKFLIVPSFLTSLTTIVGFACLTISQLSIIRTFGLWAALAALTEWIVMFLFLPSVITLFPKWCIWIKDTDSYALKKIEKINSYTLPKRVFKFLIFMPVLCLLSLPFLNYNDSPREIFPEGHPRKNLYHYLQKQRGWESIFYLIFKNGKDIGTNQNILHKIKKNDSNIFKIENPYNIIEYFTKSFSSADARLIRMELKSTKMYQNYFSYDNHMRVPIYLKNSDLNVLIKTFNKIEKECQNSTCWPAGEIVAFAEQSSQIAKTFFQSLFTSILIIGCIIVLLAKSFNYKNIWKLLLASFWGPCIVLGIMSFFQIPLNLLTCIVASVLVGLTGDNAIHYLLVSKRRGDLTQGIAIKGSGSIQVSLMSAASSLVLLGMTLVPMTPLGLLLCAGFLASLLGDLWILKSFLQSRQ